MGEREWKPGDVAAVTITRRHSHEEPSRYQALYVGERYGWQAVSDGEGCGRLSDNEENFIIDRRPLVVLDPEDREQARHAAHVFHEAVESIPYKHASYADELTAAGQRALRSLVTPPRPDEPTGLGAVVEDETGELWIRAARINHGWHRPMGTWAAYADIAAVKILSPGVTP